MQFRFYPKQFTLLPGFQKKESEKVSDANGTKSYGIE